MTAKKPTRNFGLTFFTRDHAQHFIGNVKTTEDVGNGQGYGNTTHKGANGCIGHVGSRERAKDDHAIERVHAGHQRRMQQAGDIGQNLVTNNQRGKKYQNKNKCTQNSLSRR